MTSTTLEGLRHAAEYATHIGRASKSDIAARVRSRTAQTFRFRDDGETPNNPHFPMIWYRSPVQLDDAADPASVFEVLFKANGWRDSWRDGMYPYLHFHTGTHEVLGIARGQVKARFGGRRGRALTLKAGDVVILPAGTGHRRLSASRDLLVVGGYPAGGDYDEPRPDDVDAAEARASIARVKAPAKDPVYGASGATVRLWGRSRRT